MSVSLPRYRCTNKELEEALNTLAENVEKAINRQFHAGRNMFMDVTETHVLLLATGEDASAIVRLPWDIASTVTGAGSPTTTCKFKLVPSTVSGLVPQNIFADDLEATLTGTQWVQMSCVTDGKIVTSCTLSVEDTQPDAPEPQKNSGVTPVKFCVGVFLDGEYYNLWKKAISVTSREAFREDKSDPTIAELPYDSWWGWTIS